MAIQTYGYTAVVNTKQYNTLPLGRLTDLGAALQLDHYQFFLAILVRLYVRQRHRISSMPFSDSRLTVIVLLLADMMENHMLLLYELICCGVGCAS